MAYLIDGNNLIGHTSSLTLRDPRSKYSLVAKLLLFQRLKRTKVFLVFDGAPDPHLMDKQFQKKAFSISYPFQDQNADELIKKIISKQTDLRRFFVVSSDREIKKYAKAKGAKTLGCDAFNKELRSLLREHKKSLEEEKKGSPLSPLEVGQWLKIFKKKDD